MPKFVIEREIPGVSTWSEADLKAASETSLKALREIGPQIQWIHSFVTDDKLYCVYMAPDEATVREHARRLRVSRQPDLGRAAVDRSDDGGLGRGGPVLDAGPVLERLLGGHLPPLDPRLRSLRRSEPGRRRFEIGRRLALFRRRQRRADDVAK